MIGAKSFDPFADDLPGVDDDEQEPYPLGMIYQRLGKIREILI